MIEKLKTYRSILLTLLITIFLVQGLISASFVRVYADDENNAWSFYNVSSAAAMYYGVDAAARIGGEDIDNPISIASIGPGNAGGLLGYSDDKESNVDKLIRKIAPPLSSSSQVYNYESFYKLNDSGSSSLYKYTQFGSLLAQLGVDKTGTGMTLKLDRFLIGSSMILVYTLASLVPRFFAAILGILRLFNPFQYIIDALNSTMGSSIFNSLDADGSTGTGEMSILRHLVVDVYTGLYSISWAFIIPIFICILIFSFLLFNSQDKWGKLRKLFIRMFFIGLGVPLMGLLYTSSINQLDDYLSMSSNSAADKLVKTTFVDFAGWASGTRLSIPEDINLSGQVVSVPGVTIHHVMAPTTQTRANIRRLAAAINGLPSDQWGSSLTEDAESIPQWNSEMASEAGEFDANRASEVYDMLERYAKGTFYTAGDWETVATVSLEMSGGPGAGMFFKSGSDVEKYNTAIFARAEAEGVTSSGDESSGWEGVGDYNLFANGTLETKQTGGENSPVYTFVTNGSDSVSDSTNATSHTYKGGLSTMAMYNYLSTTFGVTGMTVYSSKIASSSAVKESHYSVNLIGTGIMSFLYWFNAFVLLFSYAVLGFFYGLALLFSNISKGIKTIMSIPFAMLGVMKSIVKFVAYVIAMIVEIVATMFMYLFACEFLFAITTLIEGPLAFIFSARDAGATFGVNRAIDGSSGSIGLIVKAVSGTTSSVSTIATYGPAIQMVMLIISIIVSIVFTITALRMRKSVVKGLSEAIDQIVEKVIMGDNSSPSQSSPGFGSKAGGAIASGTGMALGQKIMGGGDGSDSKNPEANEAPGSKSNVKAVGVGADGSGQQADAGKDGAGGGQFDVKGSMSSNEGAAGFSTTSVVGRIGNDKNDKAEGKDALNGGFLMLPGSGSDDQSGGPLDANDTSKVDNTLDNMTGQTSMSEQDADDERKADIKKDAFKEGVGGVADTGVGVAKTYAGVQTGDVQMAAEGVQQANKGINTTKEAKNKADAADRNVNAERANKNATKKELGTNTTSSDPVTPIAVGAQGDTANNQTVGSKDVKPNAISQTKPVGTGSDKDGTVDSTAGIVNDKSNATISLNNANADSLGSNMDSGVGTGVPASPSPQQLDTSGVPSQGVPISPSPQSPDASSAPSQGVPISPSPQASDTSNAPSQGMSVSPNSQSGVQASDAHANKSGDKNSETSGKRYVDPASNTGSKPANVGSADSKPKDSNKQSGKNDGNGGSVIQDSRTQREMDSGASSNVGAQQKRPDAQETEVYDVQGASDNEQQSDTGRKDVKGTSDVNKGSNRFLKDAAMNAALIYAASSDNPTVRAAGQSMLSAKAIQASRDKRRSASVNAKASGSPPPARPADTRRPTQAQYKSMSAPMRRRYENFVRTNEASDKSDVEKAQAFDNYVDADYDIVKSQYDSAREQYPDEFKSEITPVDQDAEV